MSLADELARFDPSRPLESARTIPNTWYTSPELAETGGSDSNATTYGIAGAAVLVAGAGVVFFARRRSNA